MIFFKLFEEENIPISNDKYKDFFKLSEFFKIKKITNQLKIYFQSHTSDVDFAIRLLIEEFEKENKNEKVDNLFKSGIKKLMIDKINECLQNENFHKIPVLFIYQIIEQADKEKLSSDFLFDFIKKAPDNLYVLFKFIKLENLSKNSFDEFCQFFLNSDKNKYLPYLSCDLEYIKNLRLNNLNLENDKKEIEKKLSQCFKENSNLKNQLIQMEQNNEDFRYQINGLNQKIKQLENDLNQLKKENTNLKTKNKSIENENDNNKKLIEQIKEDKNKLENQIKDHIQMCKSLQNKIADIKSTNELFSITLNSLFGSKDEINYRKGFSELQELSNKGQCLASYILGLFYAKGEEVDKDFSKAIYYFEKSCEQGNEYGLVRIGNHFYLGRETEKNYKKAIEYYQKATELGSSTSFNNLGECYFFGRGVKKNYPKAVELYQKAADNGSICGIDNLGYCYNYGLGIEQNYLKAIEYYQKAAEKGSAFSLKELGDCYYNGKGIEQNNSKAIEYYKKAAKLGNQNAKDMLNKLCICDE